MIKVHFVCRGTPVYDNAYLRRLGQHGAEYKVPLIWNTAVFDSLKAGRLVL